MKFIEKYKKKLIIGSIAVGFALQIGGAYGGYVVYGKFKQVRRIERTIKKGLERIERTRLKQDEIIDVVNTHTKGLRNIEPKLRKVEEKLRKLERKWK